MYIFAFICLLLAFLCSAGFALVALLQLWQRRTNFLGLVQYGLPVVTLFLLLASALLLHALFWQDYSLEYVAAYTDRFLPVFYRLTAFWAGQPGSMLFWGASTSLCGLIFVCLPRWKGVRAEARFWFFAIFYSVVAFFCFLLIGWNNPFIMLDPPLADGTGLNPLLQNPGMIIHPPLLFLGYAAFTPVAACALASMISDPKDSWFELSRPFIIIAWLLLSAGIVLGAWWAYMELGWGGYWGWDPVENASLLPWLSATAGLHTLIISHRSGKLQRTSAFLMALTVALSFFATYLTRSGIIQSVHAFGDGGVGMPLLCMVIASAALSVWICLGARRTGQPLSGLFSQEGMLVITAWVFLLLALVIAIATMWPVFSGFGGLAQGLDASFYNRVCLPLGTLLILLLCFCTWLGASGPGIVRGIFVAGAFLAAGCAFWVAGYQRPLPLLAGSAAIAALCATALNFTNGALLRSARGRAAIGAHAGVALIALGIAFSGPYKIEKELVLEQGGTAAMAPYAITLESVRAGMGNGYDFLQAELKVELEGKTVATLLPERRIYNKFASMQFSEVDVKEGISEDIYTSLLGVDEDERVLVLVSIEPLVSLLWIGGALMCLLPLAGLWQKRRTQV